MYLHKVCAVGRVQLGFDAYGNVLIYSYYYYFLDRAFWALGWTAALLGSQADCCLTSQERACTIITITFG